MKIAIISIIQEAWGGSEELWADMADLALREGHEVVHCAFDCGQPATKERLLVEKGLQIIYRRGHYKIGEPHLRIYMKIMINYLLNKLQNPFRPLFRVAPDYILYNGTCFSLIKEKWLLPLLFHSKVKFGILGHYMGRFELDAGEITRYRECCDKASHMFFISKRSIAAIGEIIGQDVPDPIVLRNPVNMMSTEIVPFPVNDLVQMATVGNLVMAHKGQDLLLQVLAQTTWKSRNWQLNIFGDGQDRLGLQELAGRLGLSDRVIFHGKTDDIRSLWSKNHLLLMPSRMEGMPLAVVEAMLCGRPSVVTDVGDHTEWIEEGREGFIAAEATVESFGTALEKAWAQREQWEEIGLHAHEKAIRLFDPQPGKTLLEHIEKAVNN